MPTERQHEIQRNFEAFQSEVGALVSEHRGKFALMRDAEVTELFENLGDAVSAGHSRFGDGMFSIQEVTDRPLDLGFFSHARLERRLC